MEEITSTELKQRLDKGRRHSNHRRARSQRSCVCTHSEFRTHTVGPGIDPNGRDRSQSRNRGALQDGRPQRARDRGPSAIRFSGQTDEPQRRDSRLVGRSRSKRTEILVRPFPAALSAKRLLTKNSATDFTDKHGFDLCSSVKSVALLRNPLELDKATQSS